MTLRALEQLLVGLHQEFRVTFYCFRANTPKQHHNFVFKALRGEGA